MTVAVQQPNRAPKKDPLDILAQGLGIAGAVYGIKSNMAQLEKFEQDKARVAEADSLKKKNVISAEQEADLKSKGGVEVAAGTPGAVQFTRVSPGGVESPLHMVISKPQTGLITPFQQAQLDFQQKKHADELGLKERELAARSSKDSADRSEKANAAKPAQSTTAALATKAEQSERIFSELAAKGFDRSSYKSGVESLLPRVIQSGDLRKMDQAERNFVNSVLRDESGATITEDEMESARQQYFPRAGDPPEAVAQKAESRAIAIAGLKQKAGSAIDTLAVQPSTGGPKKSSSGQAFAAPSQSPAIKPGTEDSGYVFMGGDPGDPKSWKRK